MWFYKGKKHNKKSKIVLKNTILQSFHANKMINKKRRKSLNKCWLVNTNSNYINCDVCGSELDIEDVFFTYVCWVCSNTILDKNDFEKELKGGLVL